MRRLMSHVLFQELSQVPAAIAAVLRTRADGLEERLELANGPGLVTYTTVLFCATEEYLHEALGTGDCAGLPPRPSGGPAFRIVKLLLEAGADANAILHNRSSGSILSPMSMLASHGVVEGVRLYVDSCSTLDVMAPGLTEHAWLWPVQVAIDIGSEESALLLIRHPTFDAGRDPRPLIAAVERNNLRLLTALLEMPGAHRAINKLHPTVGTTALVMACFCGHSCVLPLLDAGADALQQGSKNPQPLAMADHPQLGSTPMAAVLKSGCDAGLIDALVEHGAARPTLRAQRLDKGTHVWVGPDGAEVPIIDYRSLRAGDINMSVFDMRKNSLGLKAPGDMIEGRLRWTACRVCGKPPEFGAALLSCARCRTVCYCDRKCQEAVSGWRGGGGFRAPARLGSRLTLRQHPSRPPPNLCRTGRLTSLCVGQPIGLERGYCAGRTRAVAL